MQIYMEEVKDLLGKDTQRQNSLQIRENADGSIRIAGMMYSYS